MEHRLVHELKCDPQAFDNSIDGYKNYEIRLDDRGFVSGDTIRLRETIASAIDMAAGAPLGYTGRERWVSIVMIHEYMTPFLQPGYIAFAVAECAPVEGASDA